MLTCINTQPSSLFSNWITRNALYTDSIQINSKCIDDIRVICLNAKKILIHRDTNQHQYNDHKELLYSIYHIGDNAVNGRTVLMPQSHVYRELSHLFTRTARQMLLHDIHRNIASNIYNGKSLKSTVAISTFVNGALLKSTANRSYAIVKTNNLKVEIKLINHAWYIGAGYWVSAITKPIINHVSIVDTINANNNSIYIIDNSIIIIHNRLLFAFKPHVMPYVYSLIAINPPYAATEIFYDGAFTCVC